jgi:hypothetical protein
MKRIAVGRKNWLAVGSPRGGQTAAVLFSITSTCERLGVEPWEYLRDVLTRLPTTPAGQLSDLLPDHWQSSREPKVATPPEPATETAIHPADSVSYPPVSVFVSAGDLGLWPPPTQLTGRIHNSYARSRFVHRTLGQTLQRGFRLLRQPAVG